MINADAVSDSFSPIVKMNSLRLNYLIGIPTSFVFKIVFVYICFRFAIPDQLINGKRHA